MPGKRSVPRTAVTNGWTSRQPPVQGSPPGRKTEESKAHSPRFTTPMSPDKRQQPADGRTWIFREISPG